MRKLFLVLGTAGAIGNLSLIVWEAVSMASTTGGAVVAAFQKGFLTACALLGPMLGAHLVRKMPGGPWGRRAFGLLCFAVILCAMAFNAKQSLDAMMKTTDQTIAERSKAKDTSAMARAELKRLQALPPLSVPPTTVEAVRAAEEALKAATRVRLAECGENNEKRRTRCMERERDERTAREALATVMANKTATDAADKVTARKEALEAQLKASPSVTDADPGAAVWERLFGIDPELGRTWQGMAGVVLIELLIAFLLLGFEMLRQDVVTAPAPPVEKIAMSPKPIEAPAPRSSNVLAVLTDIVQPANRKSRVEIADLLAAYVAECKSRGAAAAGVEAFGVQAKAFADAASIRVLSSGGKLYWCGVRLGPMARKQGESA